MLLRSSLVKCKVYFPLVKSTPLCGVWSSTRLLLFGQLTLDEIVVGLGPAVPVICG